MSRALVLLALFVALPAVEANFAAPSPGAAADYYLKVKGIDGEAADGSIRLAGFAWDTQADVGRFATITPVAETTTIAASPRDAASGLPTGRRMHKPFTIVKEMDKASPKLMEACAKGTPLGDVEVWSREGEQAYLRYTLKEAIITSYSIRREPSSSARPMESISLNFTKVELNPAQPASAAVNLNSSKSNRR